MKQKCAYVSKIKLSYKNVNHRLFWSLLVMSLVPTIYTTLRVFWLGNMPGDWSYSVAGQLSWVNLIYEVVSEAIILPLFYFTGQTLMDKKEFANRIKTGLAVVLSVYLVISLAVIMFTKPLLNLMATDASIIDASATYIRIEAIANIFSIMAQFVFVGLVTLGKDKLVYALTGAKLILSVGLDMLLVSDLSCSAKLGVNGIGYSNIIVNASLFVITLWLLTQNGVSVTDRAKMNFGWMKEFVRVGGISGLESFVRNIAYMIMISRMVNMVGEQGTYWVANNFIWGWLLLPILSLGDLIKKETATDKNVVKNNTIGYFTMTAIVIVVWCALIPIYKPFMSKVLNYSDVDRLFKLVMVLFGFYILFAIQNVFDATFYGLGKTHYMLFESIVTNSIYYGAAFILYVTGVWTPTLIGIALLFGIGNAFDTVVSFGAYVFLLKRNKINVFC